MTETLFEILARRKEKLQAEVDRLQIELRQIAHCEAILAATPSAQSDHSREHRPATIKDQVVKILADSPRGLTALEIQARLSERFDRIVKRESLSPQLSRLGAEGVLKRDGKVWQLPMVGSALDRFREGVEVRAAQKGLATNGTGMQPLVEKEKPQELYS